MASVIPSEPFPRISGRKGAVVRLNVTFYKNGIPSDPYAIRRIDIYQGSKKDENLVLQVPVGDPASSDYPSPITQVEDSSGPLPGQYYYDLLVPDDFDAPSIFIDEWSFIGEELIAAGGTAVDLDDETLWDALCNRFWVYEGDGWYGDDGLIAPRFGFEPLDRNFTKPEVRPLEIGVMPLPLYDFDFNRVAPLIPRFQTFINIETLNSEVIIEDAPCTMAIRQGTFRTNPFVIRYQIDTGQFLIGTYRYRVSVCLPNGETRVSPNFTFQIS